MPSAERVIRKLPKKRSTALDERPSTTYWMLTVWAALLTLLVVGLGGWDDTRLLYNGWCRLATVAATWGLLAWAASAPPKWLAQRLRLGVATSLAIHTLLAMLLLVANLKFLITPPKPDVNRVVAVETVEVPKLVEVTQPTSKAQPVFDKPVPTDQLTQQQTAEQAVQASAQAEPTTQPPELASQPAPQSLAKRPPRTALTHRAEDPGKRSRQQKTATLVADTPTEQPPDLTQPAALAKTQAADQPERRQVAETAPAELNAQTPAPQKIAERPERTPPQPIAAEAIAQRDRRVPTPAELETPTPDAATLANTPPAEPIPTKPQQPQQRTRERMAVDTPAVATATPTLQADRRRAPTKLEVAQQAKSSRPTTTPKTEAKLAPMPAPSEAIAAAAPKSTTREISSSPAPRVLANSRGGTGSRGDGLNTIDERAAAPKFNAPFAAAAAKRNRSSQSEQGPALTPTPASKVARGRASAETPSSSLLALPIPNAQVAGAERPQESNASSSATLSPQFGKGTLGDITAAKGEANFDTGPPQIAPERGTGRGALGGRMAMTSPETKSGLGPRRSVETATSPTGGATAPAPLAAELPTTPSDSSSSSSNAVASDAPTQPTGPTPAVARATVGEAPASPSASNIPAVASRRTSGPRGVNRSPQTAGPTLATGTPTTRPRGGGASPSAMLSAIDPVAIAVATPLAVDRPRPGAKAAPGIESRQPTRRAQLTAEPGPGGTGLEVAIDPGLPQRIARRQTPMLRMTPSRFANRIEGGQPLPRRRTRNPAPAFAARTGRLDTSPIASPDDPRPKTEAAIELGLAFLAPLQQADGRWSLDEFGPLSISQRELPSLRADGAATGLALLAYLGGGYDHFDDKYRGNVQRGIDYLISEQGPDGDIFPERDLPGKQFTRFYSHGIAALALCEAYGMTGDETLREPAQRALDYIMATQHPTKGGWRYIVGQDSDLSVTGWQVMALRSGELAGLRVDPNTYRRTKEFVARCREQQGARSRFRYNPYVQPSDPPATQHGKNPGTVMTSVGMLMSLYFGEARDTATMQDAADHLLANLPTHGDSPRHAVSSTIGNPRRDTYYWYYATQVMFHMGGEHWQQWHEHLHPLLVNQQTQEGPLAGSWNPLLPVPDRWGPHGGRIYLTCMNLLSLEVSYRHLPLYEMTGE